MFNCYYHKLNNSASVDYSYTVNNLVYEKDSLLTNNVELILAPSYNYCNFYVSNYINFNNLNIYQISTVECSTNICSYSIKCTNGFKFVYVEISLTQYIYYLDNSYCYQCYTYTRYLDYQIPLKQSCIKDIDVESFSSDYNLSSNNLFTSNILIQVGIM